MILNVHHIHQSELNAKLKKEKGINVSKETAKKLYIYNGAVTLAYTST